MFLVEIFKSKFYFDLFKKVFVFECETCDIEWLDGRGVSLK
jgi:hypothetical protein